ncbi:hypothetical protein ACNKHW_13875 [Shigella flexneri]
MFNGSHSFLAYLGYL